MLYHNKANQKIRNHVVQQTGDRTHRQGEESSQDETVHKGDCSRSRSSAGLGDIL